MVLICYKIFPNCIQRCFPGVSSFLLCSRRCKDTFVKTCRRKIEQISEEDLYVEGEFMAESDMTDEGIKEHLGIMDMFHLLSHAMAWAHHIRVENHCDIQSLKASFCNESYMHHPLVCLYVRSMSVAKRHLVIIRIVIWCMYTAG